jgi:hypothetical protein
MALIWANSSFRRPDVQEPLERQESALGQKLGSGGITGRRSLIHWARAFRVAARPSHYLSLRYAANTQVPFYT